MALRHRPRRTEGATDNARTYLDAHSQELAVPREAVDSRDVPPLLKMGHRLLRALKHLRRRLRNKGAR